MTTRNLDAAPADALKSKQKIAELTAAYCRGVDKADAELLKSIFHDDSRVDSGAFNGNGQKFATEICAILRSVFSQTYHSITRQTIEVDGDQAIGETYVMAVATMLENENYAEILTGGRYIDRFERRHGEWKILERRFICDWSRKQPSGLYGDGNDPVQALWH